jgi:hypothetical protein
LVKKKIWFKKKILGKKFGLKKILGKKILVKKKFWLKKKEPYRIWDLFTTPPNGPFFLQKNLKKIPNCRKLNSTSDFQYIKSIILCIDGQKRLFIRCKINLTIRLLFIFLLYKYKAYELILHYA